MIVVDDLSPIDITALVEAVEGLPNCRILRNAVNIGHAQSRNVGIRAARGDLIAFLDHDDVWLPEKLARQLEVLEANPDAAMVFCDVEQFGSHCEQAEHRSEHHPGKAELLLVRGARELHHISKRVHGQEAGDDRHRLVRPSLFHLR